MTVFEQIRHDWLDARKAHDRVKATLLGTLVGSIGNKEKTFNPARPVTEAEVVAEVKKMLDGVVETGRLIANMPEREDQRVQNDIERNVLQRYMPKQMDESDIEAFAIAKKAEGQNMAGIMLALRTGFPGGYDGKLASSIVKRVLA